MRFSTQQVVWQEVPDEVSLTFLISGCQLGCRGCHSADSWDESKGTVLDLDYLKQCLEKYRNLLTCVLFMGGEWHEVELINLLKFIHENGLKTCLYTGLDLDEIKLLHPALLDYLDFIKVGRFDIGLGGLESPNTNQLFLDLKTGECLNHRFIKSKPLFS